ncbi:pyocin knob domain-containing protein [uncultured Lactobacillus sp.]|uniref:pyocin knob domain-containing protein n=1 Tax=uncultured Lactobacillus sp. TaxID=153152 RepID=UPI00258421D4|nr:hypothetical protein [uncultured Lactobacillus sp.]
MSSIRDPAVITSVGRQMMTAGGDITYTKAILYGQDISHLTKEQLEGLTSIGSPLLTVPVGISDKNTAGNNNTVVLESTFQNASLKADLSYTAVGFFAKRGDGDEKLIIICVANPGAVLIATPPDGVATDALDIKVAIAIGDATNVTAVIDPAGSVTPATLNSAVNKLFNDLTAQIDTKANKTDVNAALDTKADKTQLPDLSPYAKTADVNSELDKKADKTALDDYAKSSDVAADVKQLSDSIATKADANTVDDAIGKIDFSPYAKTVDVNEKLAGKANTTDLAPFARSVDVDKQIEGVSTAVTNASNTEQADVDKINKALATKRDITDSYSKDELDKKFLQLSTDTGGKVDANQVATMIENKADKSDVTKQIGTVTDLVNTKANSTDVDAALDKKDDITDVDAKIKTVTDLANQVSQKADDNFNKRPVINGAAGDDLFAYKSNQLRLYPGNGQNCKNLPPAGNNQWYTVEYIFETPNNDGVAIYRSPLPEIWVVGNNGGTFGTWHKLANDDDFNNLKNQINTKANSSDVYVRKDVDNAFSEVRDSIGKLEGSQTVDSPDFNNLTDTGVYYVSDSKYKGMTNGPTNNWGVLVVSNGSNNRISQVYYPDSDVPPWMRVKSDTWHKWIQLGTNGDIQTAANLANAASNKVDTVLANSYFRKQGMDANGNCIEIRGNATKQSNGGYAFDIWSDDWTASKLKDVLGQLPSKANTADVNNALNDKANTGDVSALQGKVNVNTPLFREISADSTWEDIFGVTNPNNVLTSLRINPGGSGQLVNDFAAGIGFGGNDTKAVITVDYGSHVARFTAGNGTSPGWSEDVAWKSDVTNLQNQVNTKASASDVNSLNQTISALQQTIADLKNTISQQATQITGLQTQVNNQANEIKQLQETTIKGKTFSKSQEAAAEAWEKQNSQQIAFILDN